MVAAEHDKRVPGRLLSEIIRELRNEYQTPTERLAEFEASREAKEREQYQDAVRGLAQQYAEMMSDKDAATLIYDLKRHCHLLDHLMVQRRLLRLDIEMLDAQGTLWRRTRLPGCGTKDVPTTAGSCQLVKQPLRFF
jgi:hypothetical protein